MSTANGGNGVLAERAQWPLAVAALAGHPNPRSRTLRAATVVQERLVATLVAAGRPAVAGQVVDAADIAHRVFDPGQAECIADVLESLALSDVLVVASPTRKASYSGLLKALLDHAPRGLLSSTIAVPLMVGATPAHALAVEVHLRPLLAELGATVPGRGLPLLESDVDSGAFRAVIERWLSGAAADLVGLVDARRWLGFRDEVPVRAIAAARASWGV
ncbi:hypothetical protein GCM10012275_17730 [Longimycelium tulufanense]|uniref:NADPH-dependent FMN reductase-like domain-containing protein n=1 Tax=Longimycelium tulufanense TaxID=907463 RepID=A0A8J3CCS6_9PSEU|nr:NAD(P)H-dependent oxidoreductase [Longimycelium tulufanense]GGM47114.1 hypothetical protein GCM10012275_17730 [Longimycelium tulufanense]